MVTGPAGLQWPGASQLPSSMALREAAAKASPGLNPKGSFHLGIPFDMFLRSESEPTGGAIVLGCAVTLPKSIGRLRLSSRDRHAAPHIHYNFIDDPNDLDRLVEAVRLSRKIGRTAPFSDLIDHEMAPGNAVDDGATLRANIVATVNAYLHPTSTVPIGADSDQTAVVDAWGKVRGVEA